MLNKRFIFLKAALTLCPLSSLLADTPGLEYDHYPIDTLIVDQTPHKKNKDIQKQPQLTEQQIPWLTGPLLTPSANVVPSGHYNIEPYLYGATNYGAYNNHWHGQSLPNFYNLLFQVPIQIGLPGPWDFQFVPQWEWNHTHGASSWALGDLNLGFDYQIIASQPHKWWPSIKLQLRANLPIGKYQKLNPNKKLTQAFGTGSWLPDIGLVFSKLFHFHGKHFLATRAAVSFTYPTAVHVKSYNIYGGGHGTHGKVYPGPSLSVLYGMEFTLSQRWALAFDAAYTHINRTRFTGHKGETNGVPNAIGSPSAEQFSIAPAIEYNWSAYVGMIGGAWFTVGGRNAGEFATGIIAINIYI